MEWSKKIYYRTGRKTIWVQKGAERREKWELQTVIYGQCSFLAFHLSKHYGNNSRVSKEELNKRRRSRAHSLTLSSICDQLNNLRFVIRDPRCELQKLVSMMLRLQYASVHLRCRVHFISKNPIFSPGTWSEENVLFLGSKVLEGTKESQKQHPGTKSQTAPMTVWVFAASPETFRTDELHLRNNVARAETMTNIPTQVRADPKR